MGCKYYYATIGLLYGVGWKFVKANYINLFTEIAGILINLIIFSQGDAVVMLNYTDK
ncbi:hypothetical protein JCM39194_04260 [Desulfotomaculum varum]